MYFGNLLVCKFSKVVCVTLGLSVEAEYLLSWLLSWLQLGGAQLPEMPCSQGDLGWSYNVVTYPEAVLVGKIPKSQP